MSGSFHHSLKIRLKPNYFQQDLALGEEEQVCHDIIKCCNDMDARNAWTSALASGINGLLQTFLRQTMKDLTKEKAWKALDQRLKDTMSAVLPLATRALRENHILDLSDFDDLVQIGTSRLLHSKGLMTHVWRNARCACNFANGWSRIWQAIFDHRIEGIHAPYTCLFCIQGTYVSVTALPPVVLGDYPPVFLPPPSGCGDSLLAYMTKQLASALLLEEGVALPICYARDGRYYLLSLKEALTNRLPGFRGQLVRYELMLAHAFDQSDMMYAEYLKKVAIPKCVKAIAEDVLKKRSDDERKINSLVKDKVLRNTLHKHGVNLCLLYSVLTCAEQRLQEAKADPELSQLYQIVTAMCKVEMVGRVLKQFIRADFHYHTTEGKTTDDERLEAVNRLAQLTAAKNADFWNDQMLPGLRKKFMAPDQFIIPHSQASPPAALKIMTAKIGSEFVAERQRFGKFVPVATVTSLFCAVMVPTPQEDKEDEVTRYWTEASKFDPLTIRYRTFAARAIVRSALLKSQQKQLPRDMFTQLLAKDASSDEEVPLERLRFSSLVAEFFRGEADVKRHLEMLDNYQPKEKIDLERNSTLKSMQMLRMVMLRLVDDPPGSLKPAEEALDIFHKMKWADFSYNDIFDNSLIAIEAEAEYLSKDQLEELHQLTLVVKGKYDSIGKKAQGVKYVQRVLKSFLVSKTAASMKETRDLAMMSVDDHNSVLGVENWRSMLSVYYLAYYASYCCGDVDRAKATMKLIEMVHGQHDTDRHRGIATAGPTQELMLRAVKELKEEPGTDFEASEKIMHFVHYFGEWYLSLLVAQRVGKGYLDRLRVMNWLEVFRRRQQGDNYNPWVPRLTRFFKKYAPARVVEVDGLLKLHKGKERELLRQLELEYGVIEPEEDERIPPHKVNITIRHPVKAKDVGGADGKHVDHSTLLAHTSIDSDMNDIIRDIFNVCDTDNDGRVTAEECFDIIKAMCIMDAESLKQLFVSKYAKRKITFIQFREMVLTGRLEEDAAGGKKAAAGSASNAVRKASANSNASSRSRSRTSSAKATKKR